MSFSDKLGNTIKNFLPAPFTIAVLLSLVTFLLAFFISDKTSEESRVFEILSYWEKGLWDSKMTVFAMQMMLMLVLGHSLALTKPINKLINTLLIKERVNADATILDIQDTTISFIHELNKQSLKVISFEDQGEGRNQVDLLIDCNLRPDDSKNIPQKVKTLFGLSYSVLGPNFETQHIKKRDFIEKYSRMRETLILLAFANTKKTFKLV